MDPNVSTSFIPKEALAAQKVRAGGMGLFFLIALLMFVISLVAAGLAVGYRQYLNKDLADNKAKLELDKGAFDPATINDLVRMDSRLTQAGQLLDKHVAPSGIFDFLAQKTLQNVQFTGFQYTLSNTGTANIELDGVTDSFATIALQSDALGKSTALKDVIFSNITVEENGQVGFTVEATVDPSLISYAKQVATAPAATPQTTTQ